MRGCAVAAALAGGLAIVVACLLCGGVWAAGTSMNAGPVEVSEVGPAWTVSVDYANEHVGQAPAVADALRTRCAPMTNGPRVIFSHLWYQTITDGYDSEIILQDRQTYEQYMLYVWGDHVFLRDEVAAGGYRNRVLTCDLDAGGWKALAGG